MIGGALHLGLGIAPDRTEAAHWLMRSAAQGNPFASAYLNAKAGMATDLQPDERTEAERRASMPLAFLPRPKRRTPAQPPGPPPSGRTTAPTRMLRVALLAVLLYAGAYAAFRQSHAEVSDRDKRTYVIYPETYGRPLYYLWRPLSYLDTPITGMQHQLRAAPLSLFISPPLCAMPR